MTVPADVRDLGVPSCRTVAQVHADSVKTLGLDPDAIDLEAPEAIAGLVRRAVAFLAPCAPRTLRETVLRGLLGLVRDQSWGDATLGKDGDAENAGAEGERPALTLRERVSETIQLLVAYGDLLELPGSDDSGGRLLYLAPPTFVRVSPGVVFLLGGCIDGQENLPEDLRARVSHVNHTRRIYLDENEELLQRLRAFGFIELPPQLWLAPPRRETPSELLGRAERALGAGITRGEVAGLTILDPARSPTYYRGRWTSPGRRSGHFVARREQRYGADLWSYLELVEGQVTRLADLPLQRVMPDARGCDEAWRLQLAIDALARHPQRFRVRRSAPSENIVVDFFSPIPRWAQRRWDVLGEAVEPDRSLFAYRFPRAEFSAVRRDLEDDLWLTELEPRPVIGGAS